MTGSGGAGMQIKRLRIAGFKSFAEPAELRIGPGLTGVVGPNGCGKSNLLEALRWAMGGGSAGSLRGAETDDVIFAGTATRPPRDLAEVSILAEIDGEETEIVRRIARGGGSLYRIDGRDGRARDVDLFFADAATRAHSPALVDQGQIGTVIGARPADRRAMLEQAAGMAGLHVRRREAEARLRATEANLARVGELIADREARASALRLQARAAERYRALSEQINIAEARMIFAGWRDAAAASDAATRDVDDAERRVRNATAAEHAAMAIRVNAVDGAVAARAASLRARDAAGDAGHRLAEMRTEHASMLRQITERAASVASIAEDRAHEEMLVRDAADAIARLGDEAAAQAAAIQVAMIPALDAKLANEDRNAHDIVVAAAQALAEQAAERAQRQIADAALDAATVRLERAERELAQTEAAIEALTDPKAQIAERDESISARDTAMVSVTRATQALDWAETTLVDARAEADRAGAARAAASAALAALDGEAAALVAACVRGEGRLLDAINVVPGFERALAAAFSDELDLPAEAWAGSPIAPTDPPPPAGTLPLSDRITAPPALARRLAQIFLVEADAGQVLAIGQRIVTREGVLRRWDGFTTSGGGVAAAERLERANRLAHIEAARPAAQTAADRAEAACAAIHERIARATLAGQGARTLLRASEAQVAEAERRADRAMSAIEHAEAQRDEIGARRAVLAGERDDAAIEHTHALANVAALGDVHPINAHHDAEGARMMAARARAMRDEHDRETATQSLRLATITAGLATWQTRAGDAARRIRAMDQHEADLPQTDPAEALAKLAVAIVIAEETQAAAGFAADEAAAAEVAADTIWSAADIAHRIAAESLSLAREARAAAAARAEHAELPRTEMARVARERFACPPAQLPERAGFEGASVKSPAAESAAHERLASDRARIGPVNLVAADELAAIEAARGSTARDASDLIEAARELRGSIRTLNREGRKRLCSTFTAVDMRFRDLFATLFVGGAAHLEMVDSADPLEAGVEIMVQPSGKRLQSLAALSGGEQALTAVAFNFALLLTNPAPICVLDEVDARLDAANIERFCDLLDRMTRDTATPYLVVTHNAVTMSRMHRLFGVTMIEPGVSRLVSVHLRAADDPQAL